MAIYALIDTASRNILGEFSTAEEATDLWAALVRADPSVKDDLVINEVPDAEAPKIAPYVAVHS